MHNPSNHIFAHTPDTLKQWCSRWGLKPFRAKQILAWVYEKGAIDPEQMTDLSKRDRETLAKEMTFLSGPDVTVSRASDGVRKILVQWGDAEKPADKDRGLLPQLVLDPARQTECVMIPAGGTPLDDNESAEPGRTSRERFTACISSQVGCPVGCRFCASGLGGLDGNLSAGRIVEQVWRLQRLMCDESGVAWGEPGGRITNIVFMGMGEPLANFKSVTQAVRTIAAPWGMGIGARRITISTVGLPKAIERLADELEIPVTLALSLHAPTDDLRRELIPWAEYTSVEELLGACEKWFKKTGREITLEYILLGGINDQPEHAQRLASVASRLRANINLIRYNEVDGLPYKRPQGADVRAFQEILVGKGLNAHIRASRGRDIAAACGQLRHEKAATA